MTQEEALDELAGLIGGDVAGSVLDDLLADVPRLMLAIGAQQEERERYKRRTHPNVPAIETVQQDRWVTPWQEVTDDS